MFCFCHWLIGFFKHVVTWLIRPDMVKKKKNLWKFVKTLFLFMMSCHLVDKYMWLAKAEDLLQNLSWFLFRKLELLSYDFFHILIASATCSVWSAEILCWPNTLQTTVRQLTSSALQCFFSDSFSFYMYIVYKWYENKSCC